MTNFKFNCLVLGLLCLLINVNSKCVTLYSNYNQRGYSYDLCSSGNLPDYWDNQVSSFTVYPGYTVQLYSDRSYSGQSYGPYNAGSYNVPANFNDQLSSIRIFAARTCPTFYSDYNQQGNSFQACISGNVPSNFNDQVSSFVIPSGYTVQLYTDGSYGGQSIGTYSKGSYNVPSQFNDQLSSIRVIAASRCPTFYTDSNQQGNSFQACISSDVPSNFNDQVSSFTVPAGYTVQLYTNGGYGGQMYGAYNSGSYNMPPQLNDQLSSIRVFAVSRCPTFYSDYNQQGNSLQLCTSGNLPADWNDQVSSVMVPSRYSISLYTGSDYSGAKFGPYTQGSYNLPSQYNDQLSSVKIFIV